MPVRICAIISRAQSFTVDGSCPSGHPSGCVALLLAAVVDQRPHFISFSYPSTQYRKLLSTDAVDECVIVKVCFPNEEIQHVGIADAPLAVVGDRPMKLLIPTRISLTTVLTVLAAKVTLPTTGSFPWLTLIAQFDIACLCALLSGWKRGTGAPTAETPWLIAAPH